MQMKNMFVGNVPFNAEDTDLTAYFEANHITPLRAVVIRDRDTGKSRGFGFVEVQDADTYVALQLDGKVMSCRGTERILNVNEAKSRDRGRESAARR